MEGVYIRLVFAVQNFATSNLAKDRATVDDPNVIIVFPIILTSTFVMDVDDMEKFNHIGVGSMLLVCARWAMRRPRTAG